ncbi:conserved protein, unknown function, partial [Hepatocystis sp. ex Piliocolobus tephrosceles]
EKKEDSNYAQNEKKEDNNYAQNEKKEDSNYAQNEKKEDSNYTKNGYVSDMWKKNDNCNSKKVDSINKVKIYLFKHKIKMLKNNKKENIFYKYNELLFLTEYIYNKSEKYKTVLFAINNDEKKKYIEIKIFIKNIYICPIIYLNKTHNFNFLNFQKAMKVVYCLKNKKNYKKNFHLEKINVSKVIYEDMLKMLIYYSFESDSFENKFFSYLHLTQ